MSGQFSIFNIQYSIFNLRSCPMSFSPNSILYEDNHLIIIKKQPGEIVQADNTGDEPLSERVKQYLKEKYSKPGSAYLGTVHRIDRPVSGIVMFAKTSKALSRMNEMLRNREIKKTYLAVVSGKLPAKSGHLVFYLRKNKDLNKSFVYERKMTHALMSELDYETIFISMQFYFLRVHPLTGRPHQIRSMLAHISCPIKGDVKYGAREGNPDGSIHLHAYSVSFVHPVSKEKIEITCAPPDEALWNFFASKLKQT